MVAGSSTWVGSGANRSGVMVLLPTAGAATGSVGSSWEGRGSGGCEAGCLGVCGCVEQLVKLS